MEEWLGTFYGVLSLDEANRDPVHLPHQVIEVDLLVADHEVDQSGVKVLHDLVRVVSELVLAEVDCFPRAQELGRRDDKAREGGSGEMSQLLVKEIGGLHHDELKITRNALKNQFTRAKVTW